MRTARAAAVVWRAASPDPTRASERSRPWAVMESMRLGRALLALTITACAPGSVVPPQTPSPPCEPTIVRMVPPQLVLDHVFGGMRMPPGASPTPSWPPASVWAADKNYIGNGDLWLDLPPDGIVRGTSVSITEYQIGAGRVEVSARRVDANAPAPRIEKDENPGGGPRDRAATIHFPTPGCWEVTYVLGGSSLRFVLLVES